MRLQVNFLRTVSGRPNGSNCTCRVIPWRCRDSAEVAAAEEEADRCTLVKRQRTSWTEPRTQLQPTFDRLEFSALQPATTACPTHRQQGNIKLTYHNDKHHAHRTGGYSQQSPPRPARCLIIDEIFSASFRMSNVRLTQSRQKPPGCVCELGGGGGGGSITNPLRGPTTMNKRRHPVDLVRSRQSENNTVHEPNGPYTANGSLWWEH